MKIAIISDSHDNLPNIHTALEIINEQRAEILIHCGDISAPKTFEIIAKKYSGKIFAAYGNADFDREKLKDLEKKHSNIKISDEGELIFEGLKIAYTHYFEKAKELSKIKKFDFIFYGHSHLPWEEKFGFTRLINPGTLAGMFNKATFAFFDTATKKAQLIIL